jgi:hypothetical protein
MIKRAKGFKLMIYFLKIEFIWFKCVFDLENYGF